MQTAFMICMQEAGFFNSSLPTRTPATCRCFLCVKILTDYEAKLLLWIVEEVLSFREKASSLLSLLVFLFSLLFPSSLSPPFLLSHAFFPPPIHLYFLLSVCLYSCTWNTESFSDIFYYYIFILTNVLHPEGSSESDFFFSFLVFSAYVQELISYQAIHCTLIL